MKLIFTQYDTYNDFILKRSTFIYKLRTDPRVVDFIHFDAVRTVRNNRVLTLD